LNRAWIREKGFHFPSTENVAEAKPFKELANAHKRNGASTIILICHVFGAFSHQ
jgi:hypothetical protein